METRDPKTFLWDNVRALMGEEEPSLDRVAKKTSVGRGNLQRMRDPDSGVELKTLTAVAAGFKLQVWQLLVPGLQAHQLPQLSTAGPLTREAMTGLASADRETVRQIDVAVRAMLGISQAPDPSTRTALPEGTPNPNSLTAVLVEAFEGAGGDALSKFRLLTALKQVIEDWPEEEAREREQTATPPATTKRARRTPVETPPAAGRGARKPGTRR